MYFLSCSASTADDTLAAAHLILRAWKRLAIYPMSDGLVGWFNPLVRYMLDVAMYAVVAEISVV